MFAWLCGGMSYREAERRVAKDFGIKRPNRECMVKFWARESAVYFAERRSRIASMAQAIDGESGKKPAPIDTATIETLRIKTLQVINDPEASARDIASLIGAVLKVKDQELAERQLGLTERRIALLESKLESVSDAVRKAKQEGGITEETLRKIEEAAKIL